ncbi:formyltransferase family protein [Aquabacter sp. CN5-332]|uniref:formyltransferase family protein n=1 Tax=Aquabacter sp. CN5-332 TaxID=3156608 RepID=UPI0032B34F29
MNILICSKRDLTSTVFLNDLLERLAPLPGCRLHLVLAERTRPIETQVPELVQMKLYERDLPFQVLFPLLEADPRPADLMTPAGLAARYGVALSVVRGINDPVFQKVLDDFSPDLILSARFSFLFPPDLIAAPARGVINVHPGRVPDYAGLYPHFFAMLAGERTHGCTVHMVDGNIDTGAILAEGEVPIDPTLTAFALNLESHLLGNRLVTDVILSWLKGHSTHAVPQRQSKLRSNTYPTPAEFEKFRVAGLSLIRADEYLDILRRFGASECRLAGAG